ncbi:MAG: hypothetical protein AAGG08_18595 [Actinomycetota bacterium]
MTDDLPGADHGHDDERLDELIHRADLDGLVRMIDDRCAVRDWAGLLRVRDRSRRAVDTGRQLWPAATLAEYRLALLAPGPFVAAVLDESDGLSGRFTIGPLTEVAAQSHTWADLAPHLDRGPRAAFVAHERLLRGDELPVALGAELPAVLDLPLSMAPWEPAAPLASYSENGAEFPRPPLPDDWDDVPMPVAPAASAEVLDDDDVDLAVRQLVEPWIAASNGRIETVCVAGTTADAIAALGVRRARRCRLTSEQALAWIAWAGASGGAHGRRRGAAAGRFGMWWLLGAIGQFDDFPPRPGELVELLDELRWWRWDAHEPEVGWQLQLAIEDDDGTAWAVVARDHA